MQQCRLRQEGFAFDPVCLSVNRISQIFQYWPVLDQEPIDYILIVIQIWIGMR